MFTFAVSIDCFRITTHTSRWSPLYHQFYAISGWMQLIKNATVVVFVGTESSHTAVQSQNSGSSRREFQIPLNIIIKIGDAIVGVWVVVGGIGL